MLVFRNILRTYLVNDPYLTLRQILFICDALRDLVPFVQFKKPEKHPWGNVSCNKVAGFSQMVPNCATYLIYLIDFFASPLTFFDFMIVFFLKKIVTQ